MAVAESQICSRELSQPVSVSVAVAVRESERLKVAAEQGEASLPLDDFRAKSAEESRTQEIMMAGNSSRNLTNVLVSAYSPFPSTLSLQLPADAPALSTLRYVLGDLCPIESQSLSLSTGRSIGASSTFASLSSSGSSSDGQDVHVRLAVRLPGGKGGFGSQLRAAGGRMNSKRSGQNNTDSCRDLNGRRLSTIKEAKKLADYLSSAPEREAARIQQTRERLEKLQEEIRKADEDIAGANAGTSTSGTIVERPAEAGADQPEASTSAATPAASSSGGKTAAAGRKRRLDDQKYVEESREINDNVKSAVAAGQSIRAIIPSEVELTIFSM